MCRWLVYKGDFIVLADLIIRPDNSLCHQSLGDRDRITPGLPDDPARNAALNGDGFGVAWYNEAVRSHACLYRSVRPLWNDRNMREIAESVTTSLAFCHVRAASLGLGVSEENCHPFKFRQFTFMHNGAVAGFQQIKRRLLGTLSDTAFHSISGTTDSEVCFALFLDQLPGLCTPGTERASVDALDASATSGGAAEGESAAALAAAASAALEELATGHGHAGMRSPSSAARQAVPDVRFEPAEMVAALDATIRVVLRVQAEAGVRTASSLNFAVTDGRCVVASRFRNSPVDQPPSLYLSYGANFAVGDDNMFHVTRPGPGDSADTVLIASEPLTTNCGDWQLVPKNHMVVVLPDAARPSLVASVNLVPIALGDEFLWSSSYRPARTDAPRGCRAGVVMGAGAALHVGGSTRSSTSSMSRSVISESVGSVTSSLVAPYDMMGTAAAASVVRGCEGGAGGAHV